MLWRGAMWNEPYLETCCRSALHRLRQMDVVGRPAGLVDPPCLERLSNMGLARLQPSGRFAVPPKGEDRHDNEVLKRIA